MTIQRPQLHSYNKYPSIPTGMIIICVLIGLGILGVASGLITGRVLMSIGTYLITGVGATIFYSIIVLGGIAAFIGVIKRYYWAWVLLIVSQSLAALNQVINLGLLMFKPQAFENMMARAIEITQPESYGGVLSNEALLDITISSSKTFTPIGVLFSLSIVIYLYLRRDYFIKNNSQ